MPITILLADSSATNKKLVKRTLINEGMRVLTVDDGEAAIRRLSEIRPDLVIADISLPGKNGYELCEFIKSDTRLQSVPVILLAGAFEPFDHYEARRVSADAHLIKPSESRVLVEVVRRLTQEKTATDKPRQYLLSPFNVEPRSSRSKLESKQPAVLDLNLSRQKEPEGRASEDITPAQATSEGTPEYFEKYELPEDERQENGGEQIVENQKESAIVEPVILEERLPTPRETEQIGRRVMWAALAFLVLAVTAVLLYQVIASRQARSGNLAESVNLPITLPADPAPIIPGGELPPPPESVTTGEDIKPEDTKREGATVLRRNLACRACC